MHHDHAAIADRIRLGRFVSSEESRQGANAFKGAADALGLLVGEADQGDALAVQFLHDGVGNRGVAGFSGRGEGVGHDRLQMMATFIRIVEAGSISGAARELRLAESSVSRQLRQLEDGLGVSLLFRTTHRLSLTEAGRSFLADCHRMVREWSGIEERFREDAVQPRGKLRVVASVGLEQLVLVELAARYCLRYPKWNWNGMWTTGRCPYWKPGLIA